MEADRSAATPSPPFLMTKAGTFTAEAVEKLVADLDQATVALQTCLHLLGEEGYISDPEYPEVAEALALYERLVGA